ncbi:MAG: superoxide dismutase [bacterium]|nr:superoxide dismutase [bacterium]
MTHELPELPFDPSGFADWTSAETFSFHHGKHHAGYVKKLNAALENVDYKEKSLNGVIASSRGKEDGVFNNAAQHFNHSFFWNCLSPSGSSITGQISEMIDRDFGSLDSFKEQFSETALKHFGSGWAWLVQAEDGKLSIRGYHDADTPADSGDKPLLTLDVWEHAYYLDFKNDRKAFIDGFWKYVNWEYVNSQLA